MQAHDKITCGAHVRGMFSRGPLVAVRQKWLSSQRRLLAKARTQGEIRYERGGVWVIACLQSSGFRLYASADAGFSDGDFASSKAKARATAAWSSLMLVYLLNKVHGHLIHSGPVVAGLFMESAMADPKWSSLMHSVAPNLMQKEVIDRLEAMRTANQQHPKLLHLRAMVAQHSEPSDNGEAKLAIILVKSSVSFPDISKAVYGLSVSCESMAAADLDRDKRPSFTAPRPNTASVWITTEQAMLQLLASPNAPPAEVLEAALVVLLTKPGLPSHIFVDFFTLRGVGEAIYELDQ